MIRSIWVLGKAGTESMVESLKKKISKYFVLDRKNPDVVVTVGGEGTIFRAFKEYPNSTILPLRRSRFGVLCQIEECDELKALNKVRKGKFFIEKVMRLEVRYKNFSLWGINDISVLRDDESANRFRIFLDGKDIYEDVLIGDGIICATPYGSTGYSWTAGGTVLKTNEKKFVLTPVCSAYFNRRTSLKGRSVLKRIEGSKIIPNNGKVAIRFFRDARIKIVADGRKEERRYFNVRSGDEVTIKTSRKFGRFLRIL